MGAELIVIVVKAPRTLDTAKRETAIEWIMHRATVAKQCRAALDSSEDSEVPKALADEVMAVFGEEPVEASELDEFDIMESFSREEAEQWVSTFLDTWNAGLGDFSDLTWRIDPDNEQDIIVVAGDSTWGDTPSGPGYDYLHQALNTFVVAHLFDIR